MENFGLPKQQQGSQSLDQVPRPTPALMRLLNRGNPSPAAAAVGGAGAVGQGGANVQAKLNLAQMQQFTMLNNRGGGVPGNSATVQQGQRASPLSSNPYSLFGNDNDPSSINPVLSAFGTGPVKKQLPLVPDVGAGSFPPQGIIFLN